MYYLKPCKLSKCRSLCHLGQGHFSPKGFNFNYLDSIHQTMFHANNHNYSFFCFGKYRFKFFLIYMHVSCGFMFPRRVYVDPRKKFSNTLKRFTMLKMIFPLRFYYMYIIKICDPQAMVIFEPRDNFNIVVVYNTMF
jgi:hypothetical protein